MFRPFWVSAIKELPVIWDRGLWDSTAYIKDRTFAMKTLLLILQHFKRCPLQSSPLYWRYTVPNVSSIVGMLPGTHFLWWRSVLLSHCPEYLLWFGNDVLLSLGRRKSLLGLSPENRVDGAHRMQYTHTVLYFYTIFFVITWKSLLMAKEGRYV